MRRARPLAPLLVTAVGACVGGLPGTAPARPSGQSALMAQTTAGQVTCDSTEHLRPFVVEWDATDLSSFEARAATDVVFVRYDKCRLEVLDGCTLDAVRGALGAYGAVTWTRLGSQDRTAGRSTSMTTSSRPLRTEA